MDVFSMTGNPLNKYFRQPAIHMELPSQGRWWRPGSIEMPATKKIPVSPLTAKDEILLRTPDALLNGVSVVEAIQSCCPAIKDAWAIPNIDVDALLIGIRIASYSNIMDVDTSCRHCGHENRHGIDLGERLGHISCPNFDKTLKVNNLVIKFKPMSYFAVNREDSYAFNEEKLLQTVSNSDLSEKEKIEKMSEYARKMLESSMLSLSLQTDFVQLEDGVKVTELEFIKEFYNNIEGDKLRTVQQHLNDLYIEIKPPDVAVICEACGKNYQFPLDFDFSSFFARGF